MSHATARRERLDAVAIGLLITCCALWGLNQVAAKAALAEVPPLTQAALRSAGAALLVLCWAKARGIAVFERDSTLRGGLLAGALFAAEFACIFVGLQFTSASRMVVFIYLAPFIVALGMPLVSRGERLSGLQWIGLATAFAGVAWAFAEAFSPAAAAPARQWLGDALGVAAALFWGATTLAIRATPLTSATAEKTLLYQLAVSGLLLALAAPLAGESWPVRWSALSIGSLAFQTVIVTFASYLTWFWLMRHYPATRISAFVLLTPVFGLAAGVSLLGEPLTLRLVVALVAVVTGLLLVNRR
jgi:drug/metabolite transporter (DMT)-like permease